MLSQIHETLDKGIKELLRNQTVSSEKSFQAPLEKLSKDVASLTSQIKSSPLTGTLDNYFGKSGSFQKTLSALIESEVKKAFSSLPTGEVNMARRWSQTSLMSPTADSREVELKVEIDRDLEAGQYEKAFTSALGSSDLSVVLHVCHKLDPKAVFKPEKTLVSQPSK